MTNNRRYGNLDFFLNQTDTKIAKEPRWKYLLDIHKGKCKQWESKFQKKCHHIRGNVRWGYKIIQKSVNSYSIGQKNKKTIRCVG